MRSQLIKFLAGIVFVVCSSSALFARDAAMVRHFDYDKNAPLDLKIINTQKRGDVTVYDITYASPSTAAAKLIQTWQNQLFASGRRAGLTRIGKA